MVTDRMIEAALRAWQEADDETGDLDRCWRAAIEGALSAMWLPIAEAPTGDELFLVGGFRDGRWAQAVFKGSILQTAMLTETPGHLRLDWATHFAPLLPAPGDQP